MVISGELWSPTWAGVLSPYLSGNLCSAHHQEQLTRMVTQFPAMVPSKRRPGLWWERADEYRKISPFQYLNFNSACVGYTPTTKAQKEWVIIPSEALQVCLPKAKRLENSLHESIPRPQTYVSQRWWSAGYHLHSVTVEGIPRIQLLWQKKGEGGYTENSSDLCIFAWLIDLVSTERHTHSKGTHDYSCYKCPEWFFKVRQCDSILHMLMIKFNPRNISRRQIVSTFVNMRKLKIKCCDIIQSRSHFATSLRKAIPILPTLDPMCLPLFHAIKYMDTVMTGIHFRLFVYSSGRQRQENPQKLEG